MPDSTPEPAGSEESEPDATDAATAELERGEDLVGSVVDDRYRLDAYLGGGGMGDVYRAEHQMMKKTVAVKVLRPDVAEEENIVERFRREAQAAAHLSHPNICSATDFGETDHGAFYLVMEYVPGRTLQELIDESGPLAPDRTVEIASQIAGALDAAHEHDIVHRDLKPENVMLATGTETRDDVRVLDFGVARVEIHDDTPSLTKTGAVFGTPDYMSPEQASGDEVDERADLYGLGSVIYEMLTGRSVFDADESVQVMAKHLTETPVPPSERVNGDIPAALEELVLELLAKEPEDRPESASAVRERLEAIAAGEAERTTTSRTLKTIDQAVTTAERAATRARQAAASATERLEAAVGALPFASADVDLEGRTADLLVAGIAVLAVLAIGLGGLVAAYLLTESTSQTRQRLESRRARLLENETVAAAMESLEEGDAEAAVDQLEKAEASGLGGRGHLAYLQGLAHAEADHPDRAVESFRRAVEHNEDYVYADDLAAEIVEMALQEHGPARDFIEDYAPTEALLNELGRVAWGDSDRSRRNEAYEILDEFGLIDELPSWQRHSVLLRRAEGCDEHRRHIEALAELANPHGMRILRIYQNKPRSGCGALGTNDCYGCIRDDLDRAIETLSAYESDDETPDSGQS